MKAIKVHSALVMALLKGDISRVVNGLKEQSGAFTWSYALIWCTGVID